MERKVLAAVLSNRNWEELNRKLACFDTVEVLSPLHNMEDLDRNSVRGLLDLVFIDIDEFMKSPANGKLEALGQKGIYVVMIADRMDPMEMRDAMRSGARDYLIAPFDGIDLQEIFERAVTKQAVPEPAAPVVPEQPKKEAKVITFFTTKGGAGKSTLATNLALSLARNCGMSVCLVDLSLQFGDLAVMLDCKPTSTIIDCVEAGEELEDIYSYLVKYEEDVYLMASPAKPEEADLVKADDVGRIIDRLSTKFDYIVVDTAASFSDVSLAALDRSNLIYVVVTPIILGVKNLMGSMEVMLNSLMYPKEKMRIVLNRSDSKSGISSADIERLIKKKIDYHVPSDGNIVVPAINRGIPAVAGAANSKFSRAVVKIAESETGIVLEKPDKLDAIKNFFAGLFSRRKAER